MSDTESENPNFTPEQAWEIYEKRILVGLTFLDSAGNVRERKQFCGDVVRANPREGIVLRLDDRSEHALPPDFTPIRKAAPGEYRLHATDDIVLDPDYLATYTVSKNVTQ